MTVAEAINFSFLLPSGHLAVKNIVFFPEK